MSQGIYGFFKEFGFLSNFYEAEVIYDGMLYPTSEAAYQAAKTLDLKKRKEFQRDFPGNFRAKGKAVKHLGWSVIIREDWEEVKYNVMYEIVLDKFTRHDDLKQALLMTGDAYIEETNNWNDVYWGVCQGKGLNTLGKILMDIRGKLS